MKAIVGFTLTAMGGFVAALNLATMFPNPEYAASWGKVFFAAALTVFGGMVLSTATGVSKRPRKKSRAATKNRKGLRCRSTL